jgi:hypothetical protein
MFTTSGPFPPTRRRALKRSTRPTCERLEGRELLTFTYVPVNFSQFDNVRIQTSYPYANKLPEGQVTLGGVPFNIPVGGKNAWASGLGTAAPYPRSLDIPVGQYGVGEVQTLLNTWWGQPGPNSYVKVECFGSAGAYYVKNMVGNVDVRDFNRATWTNSINNTTTTNVAVSSNASGLARIDKQTIDLPAAFDTQVLQKVRITDSGHQAFSGAYLEGLTVGIVQASALATTTSLTTSTTGATPGQPVTFTATVSPATATGQVQFLEGGALLGSQSLINGTAAFVTSSLSVGPHSIVAKYLGDGTYAVSVSNSASVTIVSTTPTPTTVNLAASTTSTQAGQPITFTATVSPAIATGQVQFLDGTTVLGVGDISAGVAVFTTSTFGAGQHDVTAVYLRSGPYAQSTSNTVVINVAGTSTTLVLDLSATLLTPGQALVMTVTIAPSSATGQVRFLDGNTLLGAARPSGGRATLSVTSLGLGTHRVYAVYDGDSQDAPAQTPARTVVVKLAAQLPPRVQSVSVTRGTHPSIRIVFNQAINAALARNLRNYTVRTLGGNARTVEVLRVAYAATKHSVTLTLLGHLVASDAVRLIIRASGIVNAKGVHLDGNYDGKPGDNDDRQVG